jgi:hypothetical protein
MHKILKKLSPLLRRVEINKHNLLPWNSWNGRMIFLMPMKTRNRKASFPYRITENKEEETKEECQRKRKKRERKSRESIFII